MVIHSPQLSCVCRIRDFAMYIVCRSCWEMSQLANGFTNAVAYRCCDSGQPLNCTSCTMVFQYSRVDHCHVISTPKRPNSLLHSNQELQLWMETNWNYSQRDSEMIYRIHATAN